MLIHDLPRLLVGEDTTLREVVAVIDRGELQLAIVVGQDRRLLGIISDGDVRRALLRVETLDVPAGSVMNSMPLVLDIGTSEAAVEATMIRTSLRRIPIVDDDGILVGLAVPSSEAKVNHDSTTVVVMAGGLGSRLSDLTKDRPKPLLKVGPKPMLETIVERFVLQGFENILISVNYKAEMIEGYFGDGARFGARIDYLHEDRRLGTAGALQYLPASVMSSLIVVNGDVLTTVDYRKMVQFHEDSGATATMAVGCHDVQVPFGVVDLVDDRIEKLVEKPVYRYFVNAGIYVLEPSCLSYLPKNEYMDMTTLFDRLIADRHKIASYPIHEYWQDVGRPEDYERANQEFGAVFVDRPTAQELY